MGGMLKNFGWLEAGRVAGVARILDGDLPYLKAHGISAVLTLTETPPPEALTAGGMVVRHEPVPDFAAPGVETLSRCVDFIRANLDAGRPVAVHCWAGYGRTGTVLAAWLVATGVSPDEAIARVREARPGSIETGGQEDAVRAYARVVSAAAKGGRS